MDAMAANAYAALLEQLPNILAATTMNTSQEERREQIAINLLTTLTTSVDSGTLMWRRNPALDNVQQLIDGTVSSVTFMERAAEMVTPILEDALPRLRGGLLSGRVSMRGIRAPPPFNFEGLPDAAKSRIAEYMVGSSSIFKQGLRFSSTSKSSRNLVLSRVHKIPMDFFGPTLQMQCRDIDMLPWRVCQLVGGFYDFLQRVAPRLWELYIPAAVFHFGPSQPRFPVMPKITDLRLTVCQDEILELISALPANLPLVKKFYLEWATDDDFEIGIPDSGKESVETVCNFLAPWQEQLQVISIDQWEDCQDYEPTALELQFFSGLSALEAINMSGLQPAGVVAGLIANNSGNLRDLRFNPGLLVENDFEPLRQCSSLKALILNSEPNHNRQIIGSIALGHISAISQLEHLSIDCRNVPAAGFAAWSQSCGGNLRSLILRKPLSLTDNALCGLLAKNKEIEVLVPTFDDDQPLITDAGLSGINQLPRLRVFYINGKTGQAQFTGMFLNDLQPRVHSQLQKVGVDVRTHGICVLEKRAREKFAGRQGAKIEAACSCCPNHWVSHLRKSDAEPKFPIQGT